VIIHSKGNRVYWAPQSLAASTISDLELAGLVERVGREHSLLNIIHDEVQLELPRQTDPIQEAGEAGDGSEPPGTCPDLPLGTAVAFDMVLHR